MMEIDPRIRGVCSRPVINRSPRPSVDCSGVAKGSGFRCGSEVEYNGERRFVYGVESYPKQFNCVLRNSNNVVTVLDLGDIKVPFHLVRLIKI